MFKVWVARGIRAPRLSDDIGMLSGFRDTDSHRKVGTCRVLPFVLAAMHPAENGDRRTRPRSPGHDDREAQHFAAGGPPTHAYAATGRSEDACGKQRRPQHGDLHPGMPERTAVKRMYFDCLPAVDFSARDVHERGMILP